ncbi:hypothetical protein F7734_60320 [Scytonema sp. UIC 10036]|uniref:hypothetical protein n=1 Tax=Scytonema sp. UIC 10036 TaxID=2304196 RepID=UPI0012DAA4CE|nr:hypothetical protein [Scytonema sp. UIC 10036]MUH01870.1 hypothetical protein [Scytonema sp. UIC 10036]
MRLKLFTSSVLTISLIVASGIHVTEATKATNTFNKQDCIHSVAFDRIFSVLEIGDRLEKESPRTPSRPNIIKIDRVSSGNKLQRQNPQPIVIALRCKSPCKTEI